MLEDWIVPISGTENVTDIETESSKDEESDGENKTEQENVIEDNLPNTSYKDRSDQPYKVGPEQMETLFDDTDQATCLKTISDINIDQALNGPEKMQW